MDVLADIKIVYRDDKRVKVKIAWWNKGYTGNPWSLGVITKHEISLEKFRSDWKVI